MGMDWSHPVQSANQHYLPVADLEPLKEQEQRATQKQLETYICSTAADIKHFFVIPPQKNAGIMNHEKPDSDLINWIPSENGYIGFITWFWILQKKCKNVIFWI